jgi:short-subunit dehydrogenase
MDKYTLLTGASSGIGRAYAKILASNKHHLILIARSKDKLLSLQSELIEKFKIKCHILPLDLTEIESLNIIESFVKDNNIFIEYLINNAGIGQFDYFHKIDQNKMDKMLNLNMLIPTKLTKMFLPEMIKQNTGGVQFIASIASYLPTPLYCNYGATKAYLRHFGTSLHYELKDTNLKINVLNPGVTKTDFFAKADQNNSLIQKMQMMSAKRCAEISYKAFMKNKANTLPGFLNNFTVYFLLKFTPLFLQARAILNDLLKENDRKI